MSSEIWLTTDADGETEDQNRARGGSLSAAGRRAAIGAAISLVGRYFQSGSAALRAQPALNSDATSDVDVRLLAALRFRQLLAITGQLISPLERIVKRPTFRYSLVQADSVGELSGTLDLGRYVASVQPVQAGPPVFPILDVRRSGDTPENRLAAYAALWTIRELDATSRRAGVPPGSPETSLARQLVGHLEALLNQPALAAARDSASDLVRRGTVEQLFGTVDERLRRREIAAPEPYASLLRLVRDLHERSPGAAGSEDPWSFYDESFDQRLFELWCLHQIGVSVARALAVELPDFRGFEDGLAYAWERPAGTLEVYFQRAVNTVDPSRKSVWRRSDGKDIQGKPDFVVKATMRESGAVRLAIFDAKLRQRSGPPTEELYKILGYFENFALDDTQRGGILAYDPMLVEAAVYDYRNVSSGGRLLATVLNPADTQQTEAGFVSVADVILGLLDIEPIALHERDDETLEDQLLRHRLSELSAVTAHLSPQNLEASRRRLAALIGEDRWMLLSEASRAMLATSEHVGFMLGDDADYSGPTLGLIAPIEVLLHDLLIQPAQTAHPNESFLTRMTLGSALNWIAEGLRGGGRPQATIMGDAVLASGVDASILEGLLDEIKGLNVRYRIPAAHRDVLSRSDWLGAYRAILSDGQILRRAIDVFNPRPESLDDQPQI